MRRWSQRWHWIERAAAWDAELDREYRSEMLRGRAKIGRHYAQAAADLLDIAAKGMSALDPTSLSPRDLLDYLREGTKAEAALYGLGECAEDTRPRVTIMIDPNLLPPGAVLPDLED